MIQFAIITIPIAIGILVLNIRYISRHPNKENNRFLAAVNILCVVLLIISGIIAYIHFPNNGGFRMKP